MEGTSIGNWVLEHKLGDGGMGVVYLARHKTTGASAAVKALFPARVQDAQMLAIFHQEARTQMKLHHPHIVQAHDYQEVDGQYYLVLEHLQRSLADVLAREPIEMARALTWIKQLLWALDYAHQQGVIHRDVKPSNVMLDEQEQIKVTDFGIALEIGGTRLTETGFTKGTPEYMSPEQIVRPKEVDHRTDVYSAGILLYELLTGRVPFTGATYFAVQEAQVKFAPPKPRSLNPKIPEKLEQIVLRALEKDPARRFNGCGEFARAIEAFEKDQGTTAIPSPTRRTVIVMSATAALVAVLGLGYSFWPSSSVLDNYFALREEMDRRSTPQEAVQQYQTKARNDTKNAMWQAMLAQGWSNQDNYKEAEIALKKAIELEPQEPLWQALMGDLRYRQNNKSEAQSAYQRAAAMTTNEADRNLFLGFSSYALEKWAEAEAYYRKAIELTPDRPWPHGYLGTVLRVQKKWPEAEAAYRKAISQASDIPRFHYGLGVALNQQKKTNEALTAFSKATTLAPKNPGYQNALGDFHFDQQQWPEAEAAYQKAVNLDASRALFHGNLGESLQKQQKYLEAETAYAKATEIAPKNDVYFNGLGAARYAQKKWPQAETAWQQAVNLKASNATYQGNLADARYEQKKYPEAATAYAEALRLAPQNAYYANRLGICRWELADWAGAETAFRTAVNLKPSEAMYHNNLGLTLEKQSLPSLAADAFKKAMELDSKNPTYQKNYERVQPDPWSLLFKK